MGAVASHCPMGSGEWAVGSGVGSGQWSGEWAVEWGVGSGEWEIGNSWRVVGSRHWAVVS